MSKKNLTGRVRNSVVIVQGGRKNTYINQDITMESHKKNKKDILHMGERILKMAEERHISVPTMAKWFNIPHGNMYRKLKVQDWKMSELLTVASHLGVNPMALVQEGYTEPPQLPVVMEPEVKYLTEIERLREENTELKDKLIKVYEKKTRKRLKS